MSTTIPIITMMCPLGIGNPNGECRFHRSSDNMPEDGLCPIHKLPLEKTNAPEDKITVTIMDESEVDNLIKYGDNFVPVALADELDVAEVAKATEESKTPVIPKREVVSEEEKIALRGKIAQDLEKFSLLEDK